MKTAKLMATLLIFGLTSTVFGSPAADAGEHKMDPRGVESGCVGRSNSKGTWNFREFVGRFGKFRVGRSNSHYDNQYCAGKTTKQECKAKRGLCYWTTRAAYCKGVDCPSGENCFLGGCRGTCRQDSDCTPNSPYCNTGNGRCQKEHYDSHGYDDYGDYASNDRGNASCTCSAFISNKNGQGNCEYLWKGELWCYVNQPSNCKDLGNSTSHPGKQWSLIACKERRDRRGCCKNKTAKCFSCIAGQTEEEHCRKNPTSVGCTGNRGKVTDLGNYGYDEGDDFDW